MIYFLVFLSAHVFPAILFFASCFIILVLLNYLRKLLYNAAMDSLAIRQSFIQQQLTFKQDNLKFEIEREKAQQAIKANRLQLADTRHKLLSEIDSQFAIDLTSAKIETTRIEK